MPHVLDIEQSLLLLELEPPFDKRDVQLARRRMAKIWHPDIAPPGKQFEHERHLKAINEAADQLEQLAETSRGRRVAASAVGVSAAAARRVRAEAGGRAYVAEQRERASEPERARHDQLASSVSWPPPRTPWPRATTPWPPCGCSMRATPSPPVWPCSG